MYDASHHAELAKAFLSLTNSASPISKERLRYLSDFAFVMISYACLLLFRLCHVEETNRLDGTAPLQAVADAAQLMRSFDSNTTSRPAIYGCILQRLYQKTFFGSRSHSHTLTGHDEASVDHPGSGTDRMNLPSQVSQVSPATTMSGPSAATMIDYGSSSPSTIQHASPIVVGSNADEFFHPYHDGTTVPQSMADLWNLDQTFYSFEDPAFAFHL